MPSRHVSGSTIVITLSTVGLLLAVGLLVVPPSTARLVCNRVETMMATAMGLGVVATLGGLLVSYHNDLPPGATIALCTSIEFAIFFCVTWPKRRHRHGPEEDVHVTADLTTSP